MEDALHWEGRGVWAMGPERRRRVLGYVLVWGYVFEMSWEQMRGTPVAGYEHDEVMHWWESWVQKEHLQNGHDAGANASVLVVQPGCVGQHV